MKLKRMLTALVLFIMLSVFFVAASPLTFAYVTDYRGNTTYFNGVLVNNNWTGQGVSGFDALRNSGSDRNYTEPGSAGSNAYVMPNMQRDPNTGAGIYAGGSSGKGGAIGFNALSLTDNGSGMRNDPQRKQKLFNFLQKKNQNGSAWEKMGSALIVNQMLGRQRQVGGWKSTTITPEQWTELHKRLVENNNVTMTLNPNYKVYDPSNPIKNTASVYYIDSNGNPAIDVVDTILTDPENGDSGFAYAWQFTDNGTVRYVLELDCANPVGAFGGFLPNPTEYNLVPSADIDGNPSFVEPGSSVTVTNTVTNSGKDPSGSTVWRLTQMVYRPESSNPDGTHQDDSATDPCATFSTQNRKSCDTVQEKTSPGFTAGSTTTFNPKFTFNVPDDTPVGTKICFTASVKPPTQSKLNMWRHSDLQCIIVAKKPKVQVWGGDIRVGGTIVTSRNTLGGKTYGSWGEYAALSNGQNSGFGSGNGLHDGNANQAQTGWSTLTFANTSTCTFGCFGFTSSSRALADQFGSTVPLPGGDMNSWDNGTYSAGNISLGDITLNQGKSIVILATGTVTITGDIKYNEDTYNSIKDIPQLIIRAPKIDIRGNVGRVDAWLVAVNSTNSGTLNTCSDVAVNAQLTADICKDTLTINGPVVADKLYLRRTAGSDGSAASRDTPAEIFNLRADAYLWGSSYANGKNKVRTVYTKELPPRF